MRRKLIILSIITLISAFAFAFYLYNKPHQSIADEAPLYSLQAGMLTSEYEGDEQAADKKYLGKVIEVRGTIVEKTKNDQGKYSFTLGGADLAGVTCEFENASQSKVSGFSEGQEITVKGICTGVLMDVVLVDCVIK